MNDNKHRDPAWKFPGMTKSNSPDFQGSTMIV
jgi:hypothetical protein